jgi:hypothetical protein
MTVDGTPVVVHGNLVLEGSESPIPWIALVLVAGAVAFVVGRGKSTFVAGIAMLVASVAALETGVVAFRSIPSAAGPNPLEIALPAVATVAAVLSVVLHRKPLGVVFTLASVASLSGWGFMRVQVLLHPVLPTTLSFNVDRGATALAFGCSVAAAVLAVRSGALVLRLPDLEFDDEES